MRALLVLLALVMAGCTTPADGPASHGDILPPPPDEDLMPYLQQLATFPELRFETDHGTIRMVLYEGWTPQTAGHIGALAERGFYDGTRIHRVVDDFVIQGGDTTGVGEGGSGPLGTSDYVPLEVYEGLQFGSGAVGLARWTEDTGDSQWFITEKPALHLNDPQGQPNELLGPYSLFGQVFEGMDVVRQIASVETLPNDQPVEDVILQKAELLPPPTDADLVGLVPVVYDDFQHAGFTGTLELPQYIVAGHAFQMTAIIETDEPDRLCALDSMRGGWYNESADIGPEWSRTDDACTWTAVVTLPSAGAWTFTGGTDVADRNTPFEVDVLPWHDDYAPFTGVTGNATSDA